MSINKQTKAAKRKSTMNKKREVEPEIRNDSQARNLLQNQPNLTPKAAKRKIQGKELKKHLRSTQLYGKKKKERVYTEKELGIPKLNKAIIPGNIVKRGKKGKKFISDTDTTTLQRIIKQVNDDRDLVNESKLEKSKRLEEIRELRRKEMEIREDEKKSKLENAKANIKEKASLARSARRKSAKEAKKEIEKEASQSVKRKSVSFA
ncbi:60S ribosomal subunit assembly/export protein [Pichia californica]|uniref:60S ribosomal subunit assembly/export protein LOC1 n=1 Tax=Pichia californica TaxID=460514 RepID=A0A9P7BGC6_9ASCO|nr:60S ribosomal subunit assembly/export protein [[Candida] californica]KAG0689045.1 60S ribosomal subunit assembly/export protein [[Candida] californica]